MQVLKQQPYTLDRVVRLIIGALIVCGIIWIIDILKGVLLPFCVACLIAYLLEPFVQFNRRLLNLKGRVVAIFVTLFEVTFFIALILYIAIPIMAEETQKFAVILRKYATDEINIAFLPDFVHDFLRRQLDFKQMSELLTHQESMELIEKGLSASWSIITGSISVLLGIISWCIVFLYIIFIMIDYERLNESFKGLVPPKFRPIAFKIGNDIKESMNHYFRGQALVAFIVGILFSIGFLIVGLPMAIILGLFIGLLNMVPYLQFISIFPTAVLCIVYSVGSGHDFWIIFGECLIVYAVVQVIQDLFLIPKIMGKVMGLNPAIILLSLSIWGTLLGFIGLIIALPLTTLLLSYYDHYIIGKGESKKKRDEERKDFENAIESPD